MGLLGALLVVYAIGPAEGSRFALEVDKTGFLSGKKHLFLYERYQGQLEYDPEAPEKSRIDLTIDATSAVCRDTWVKPKDLKKIQDIAFELLDVKQHPTLRFVSERIARKPDGTFEVTGHLTIRGITRPVTVAVAVDARVFTGTATVRMKDYGIKPPSAALGTIGTKNEMRVEFRLVVSNT
jgi:polyisoprenoid-binding protein YceI